MLVDVSMIVRHSSYKGCNIFLSLNKYVSLITLNDYRTNDGWHSCAKYSSEKIGCWFKPLSCR